MKQLKRNKNMTEHYSTKGAVVIPVTLEPQLKKSQMPTTRQPIRISLSPAPDVPQHHKHRPIHSF